VPLNPIGFAPSEISALVNDSVVSRHAEEAAFLWTQRHRAVTEPHFSLNDLAVLDERVEAQRAGLVEAGEIGWRCCKANLENVGPGEVFAAAVVAFAAGDRNWMFEALSAGCTSPKTMPGLISALGWLDFAAVSSWISRLLAAKSPAHRAVGIASCAVHRADPEDALTRAVDDPDVTLRARALRAVGELKRHDLLGRIEAHLRDEDEICRFWAAWSATLLGELHGLDVLARSLDRSDRLSQRALQVALRALPLEESRPWISKLAKQPDRVRLAIVGAGIAGDPASMPWLIRQMESSETARLAGEAFSMMTGVDLAFHDLDRDAPAPDEQDETSSDVVLDLNDESNLAWPALELIKEWWEENAQKFVPGRRYLAGTIITAKSTIDVLSTGKQRQRAAAALELALLNPEQPLFEVRRRGDRQQRQLASWTS
jgi:uncharacterized protein (TIGR02270 family)